MPHRFALLVAFCFITAPAPGAPVTSAKPKKTITVEEKKKDASMDSHIVKRGETLWGIARLHGVSVGDIMDLNHLTDSTLRDGQALKIPSLGSDPALAPTTATTHIVAKGETFRSIASKYGLTQEDIERANPKTNPAAPQAGSKVTIPATISVPDKDGPDEAAPPPPTQPKPPETTHTVTETDTYTSIAKKYGVTETAIGDANPDVNPNRLRPGSKLNIPQRPTIARKDNEDAAPAAAGAPPPTGTARKPGADPETTHTVTETDTYTAIAKKYGVTETAIAEANPDVNPNRLRPGSKLKIPQRPTVARKDNEAAKPAAGTARTAVAPAGKNGAVPESTHAVTETDTYSTIAKKYGVTENAIADANPGVNPNRLRPGSKLKIPQRPATARKNDESATPAAARTPLVAATARKTGSPVPDDEAGNSRAPTNEKSKSKTRRYVVSDDETPQTISEAFKISVSRLYEINGMKPGSPMKTGLAIQVPSSPGEAP